MTGVRIVRDAVPADVVEAALRRLNLELRDHYSPEGYPHAIRTTFFPAARWSPEILALQSAVETVVVPAVGEQWAEPQLLLRMPDDAADWPLVPHIDEPPPWAAGRGYRAIVGVALSRSHAVDGALAVWPGPELVELDAGDVIVLDPHVPHAATLNRGGRIRYVVYFRLLAAAVPAAA